MLLGVTSRRPSVPAPPWAGVRTVYPIPHTQRSSPATADMVPLRLRVMRHRKNLVNVTVVMLKDRFGTRPAAGFFSFIMARRGRLDDIDYMPLRRFASPR
jgi:hypothetical protein